MAALVSGKVLRYYLTHRAEIDRHMEANRVAQQKAVRYCKRKDRVKCGCASTKTWAFCSGAGFCLAGSTA